MIFLLHPAVKPREGRGEPVFLLLVDLVLAACAIATSVYLYFNYEELQERMAYIDEVPAQAVALAYILVGLSLEATRRMTGLPLFTVAIAFFAYFLWGDHLPALIRHNGATLENIAENMYLTGEGVYGIPIMLACSTLFAFMMFGAFLEGSNMSSIFMDLAYRLTRKSQGGPAKVAIFASALFGTISGSSAGNVYTTGVFTIPLMKKCGYQPHFAGAVEAVASTGGQIMPPVMGAAAFIMADLTGLGYLPIATAAVLPALLYYLALLTMIHFEALKNNLGCMPPELVPDARAVMSRLYYLGPICILILALWMGRSVIGSAFIATLSIFILSLFRRDTRMGPRAVLDAMNISARNALMISSCCAAAGIIVGVISITGIGFKFISLITELAGNSLFLLMLFLAVTCIILGMGVPTAPAYVIVATLGAPALIKAGVPMISAHLFVFYYAILSVITPPVCVTAFAGASIAESDPMRTGFVSVKLAIVAFIIPFMFVYQPALLWQGGMTEAAVATITAIIGVIGIGGAMQGWLLTACRQWERPVLLIGGLTLIYPGTMTDLMGLALLAVIALLQLARRRPRPAGARPR